MNTFFAVAAAVAALVGSVDAVACTTAQQQGAYLSLISLLTGPSLSPCATESGYNMLYATALPTDAEMIAMCGVEACHQLIVEVSAANPPDCDLNIPTSGAVMNVYELATTFESDCDTLTGTTAPPTDAPTVAPTDAPTTAPTDAPTTGPTDVPTDAPTETPSTTEPVTPGASLHHTQQQGAYLSLISLLTGPSLSPCAAESGYNMLYATALPTDAEMIAMCGVEACHQLIVEVSAANPPDCDLNVPTSGAGTSC
ncbi:hypothetical protein BBJ28_00012625 [Nothophytophthora sp. Chile5]|nr:hypothetical protein BBJ28_00012625 [Nothophytophthora sp. Chile5]